ncbi:MAG: hypothetical protein ABI680_13905, partial [Chthoniobacteraceae bacterium]
ILIEINLPQIDGWELATHLRRDSAYRGCLLIAILDEAGHVDLIGCQDAGFDHVWCKFTDLEILLRFVSNHVTISAEGSV